MSFDPSEAESRSKDVGQRKLSKEELSEGVQLDIRFTGIDPLRRMSPALD
jgi:hypothetical protein